MTSIKLQGKKFARLSIRSRWQNIADVKDAEVKKLLETYQEDVASQAAIDRYRDAMLHQMQKAVEDGDFDKMLEIKTLLGQMNK